MTRGQTRLVKCKGEDQLDFLSVFLLVVAAHYCFNAEPTVEEGTDAHAAVLAVFLEPETKKPLIASVCHRCMSW